MPYQSLNLSEVSSNLNTHTEIDIQILWDIYIDIDNIDIDSSWFQIIFTWTTIKMP